MSTLGYSYLKFPTQGLYEQFRSKSPARWRNGVSDSIASFRLLLDKRVSEQKAHDFLENHPYLLPGFGELHHGPCAGIVATKFALGPDYVTDFAFVCSNSQSLCLTCIEIESPSKKLFRKDGKFHRDYLDARQQITDWLNWAKSHRRQAFDQWGRLFANTKLTTIDISFQAYLVFGRREELTDPIRKERWSAEANSLVPELRTMTYDRLLNNQGSVWYGVDNDSLAVCSYRNRVFNAKKVIY